VHPEEVGGGIGHGAEAALVLAELALDFLAPGELGPGLRDVRDERDEPRDLSLRVAVGNVGGADETGRGGERRRRG
jgi:hypothetical protein